MIVGDPNRFAIESTVSVAYERLSFLALGHFAIHLSGTCYGVRKPDATMIALSYDTVRSIIKNRGSHKEETVTDWTAGQVADFHLVYYGAELPPNHPGVKHVDIYNIGHLDWTSTCDEAFDDGSHILHIDEEDSVRLIGFRSIGLDGVHDQETLQEVRVDTDEFYSILQEWAGQFHDEWKQNGKG